MQILLGMGNIWMAFVSAATMFLASLPISIILFLTSILLTISNVCPSSRRLSLSLSVCLVADQTIDAKGDGDADADLSGLFGGGKKGPGSDDQDKLQPLPSPDAREPVLRRRSLVAFITFVGLGKDKTRTGEAL